MIRNQGAAGVDAMGVDALKPYLDRHREALAAQIRRGDYYPQPIRGREIPKSNKKKRLLGIPTVVDRMLHDIDLQGFFDEVDHCLLLQILYRKIKCRETMRLIRRWLRVPILIEGKLIKRRKGIPQGSPLSPLLANIMLHELDREMERCKLRFVRYADDFSIYCKTEREARKTGNQIFLFLRDRLKLPINREKSGIRRPLTFHILGYGFCIHVSQRGERQIPTGRRGETLDGLQIHVKGDNPQNQTSELRPTDAKTKGGTTGVDQLFQICEHLYQAQRTGRMVTQPDTVLHLD